MLGMGYGDEEKKQQCAKVLEQAMAFKEKLEKKYTLYQYQTMLGTVRKNIESLEKRKKELNLNPSFEEDLDALNSIKADINQISLEITKLEIRKRLIEESLAFLQKSKVNIDTDGVQSIYRDAQVYVGNLSHDFGELVQYHNAMADNQCAFIAKTLPEIEGKLLAAKEKLRVLLNQEDELTQRISKGNSLDDLEQLVVRLNREYEKKGEYEALIQQIEDIDKEIHEHKADLENIGNRLYSEEFKNRLKKRVDEFNQYFQMVSDELYGEMYSLSFRLEKAKRGVPYYSFSSFNANASSGKKQGEILCFDIAYQLFKKDYGIDGLDFLLNDKKELMHSNQLIKTAKFVLKHNLQLVVPILRDKLPLGIQKEATIILTLSQHDRLFRIEQAVDQT